MPTAYPAIRLSRPRPITPDVQNLRDVARSHAVAIPPRGLPGRFELVAHPVHEDVRDERDGAVDLVAVDDHVGAEQVLLLADMISHAYEVHSAIALVSDIFVDDHVGQRQDLLGAAAVRAEPIA